MNVDSTTLATGTASNTKIETNNTTNPVSTKDGSSFKDELKVVKNQEQNTKIKQDESNEKEQKITAENKNEINEKTKITDIAEKQFGDNNKLSNLKIDDKELFNSLSELNQKIKSLNELKSNKIGKINASVEKNQYLNKFLDEKTEIFSTITMDQKDTTFFLNLVENQTMSINIQNENIKSIDFTQTKAEATQKTINISETLLNSLNESMKTNKPFRIDFDNNIAVIMRVDKDGVLSANFIPGSSAVENYLRNNLASLKQSFEEQNLEYNELTYTSQDKNKQRQNKKNKQENKES